MFCKRHGPGDRKRVGNVRRQLGMGLCDVTAGATPLAVTDSGKFVALHNIPRWSNSLAHSRTSAAMWASFTLSDAGPVRCFAIAR